MSAFPTRRRRGATAWRALLVTFLVLAGCGQRAGVHLEVRRDPSLTGAELRHGSTTGRKGAKQAPARAGGTDDLDIPPVEGDPSSVTWPQWAALFLPRISAPVCRENVIAVVAWAAQEDTTAGWNPLATTYRMAGSRRFNGAGVQNYMSLDQGLQATVLTLQRGTTVYGYAPIVDALRRCADPMETAQAINASRWCLGCSEGAYVTRLVPAVAAAFGSPVQP